MVTKTFELEDIFPAEPEDTSEVISEASGKITVKGVARFVVGTSVKFIVTSSIASLVPAETKFEKAKVLVGAYAISGLVSEKAKSYISDDIDEKVEFCREVYKQVQKLQAEKDQAEDTPNS